MISGRHINPSIDIQSFDQQPITEISCHCRNQRIQNNIFVENHRGAINLPYPAEKACEMLCDHNVYCDWDGAGLFAVNTTTGAKPDDIITALRSAQIAH